MNSLNPAWLKRVIELASKYVRDGVPVATAVRKAWARYNVDGELLEMAIKEGERAVLEGLGVAFAANAGGVSKAYAKLVNQKELKTIIAKASAKSSIDVTNEMKAVIKNGEAADKAAQRLIDYPSDAKYADVRKSIKQLTTGMSKSESRKLERKLESLKTAGLKSSYIKAIEAAKSGSQKQLNKQLELAAMEKARYNASRVVRTERERAMGAVDRENIAADPDAKLVKFKLASNHRHDVCDAYATADMGYGPGIYTLDAAPILPIHPNGRSRLVPVYVKPKGKEQNKTAQEALASKGIKESNLIEIRKKL